MLLHIHKHISELSTSLPCNFPLTSKPVCLDFQNDLETKILQYHMRPVPTKWETGRKISFPSYNQVHVVQTLSFKMIYYMSWLLPYLRSKTYNFLQKFFVFYWFLKCSMSHISFSSLVTCRSFCENRSHRAEFLHTLFLGCCPLTEAGYMR